VTCPQSLVRGKTVFNRFDRWAKRGKWKRLFEALQTDRDDEWHSLDSTVNRAHQHAAGAKGGKLGRHLVVLVVGCQPKCTWSWMLWGCR
jgi:transposase